MLRLRYLLTTITVAALLLLCSCEKTVPQKAEWEQYLADNLGEHYLKHYQQQKAQGKRSAFDFVEYQPDLPNVLLVGDSISIGYTTTVQDQLQGIANVYRIPGNGGPSINGAEQIHTWLGSWHWDLIHFNFGLHDIRLQFGEEQYQQHLQIIIEEMQRSGAVLIWATTTPVPKGDTQHEYGKDIVFNQAAQSVMENNGIAINDLYSFSLAQTARYQKSADVHFVAEGYKALGIQVAEVIKRELKTAKNN